MAAVTKYPVIAAAHPQQNPGVMRKLVGQPVDEARSRQTNSEKPADDFRFGKAKADLVETMRRHLYIDMNKPEHVAARRRRPCVHLSGTTCTCPDQTVAKRAGKLRRGIGASAIDDDNFCLWCAGPQAAQKIGDQRRLVQHGHDNRDCQFVGTGKRALPLRINQ